MPARSYRLMLRGIARRPGRPRAPRPALRPLAVALALLLVLPLAATAQDLDGARERVEVIEGDLAAVTERYEATWAEVETAIAEIDQLEREAEELAAEAQRIDALLGQRARQVFMRGTATNVAVLLSSDGPDASVQRASLLAAVQQRETAGLEESVAVRTSLAQARSLVADRQEELEALTAQLAADQEALEGQLQAAQSQVQALEVIAARQRTIDRGSQQGVYACPLDRHLTHFVDSWGAPRSGGRSHKGTDIMGPMGAPVYAFTSGVIARHSNSRLGGISLYLRGVDGDTYFYTHLQGYAPRGAVGTRVQAGELIAYNGDTGNARGGAPHIHFERQPGGGSSVNPYPYLAAACF